MPVTVIAVVRGCKNETVLDSPFKEFIETFKRAYEIYGTIVQGKRVIRYIDTVLHGMRRIHYF